MLYSELDLIDKLVFKTCELEFSAMETEIESQEYFAHNFQLGTQHVKFCTAKITPTKTGQFVTVWKQNDKGITEPCDIRNAFDFYIIATRKDKEFGLFIFPKAVRYENKILSDQTKEGKRGIRVYPTWGLTNSNQAQKTQLWQTKYFLDLSNNEQIDLIRAKNLLNLC